MKSILLPEFVFFRSRLRLSLKNTNSLFYCLIFILRWCCTSYYNIPGSLREGAPVVDGWRSLRNLVVLSNFKVHALSLRHSLRRATSLRREAFCEPVYGWQVTIAWLAGQSKAHLSAASSIRAMPETEIPPVSRGDNYFLYVCLKNAMTIEPIVSTLAPRS